MKKIIFFGNFFKLLSITILLNTRLFAKSLIEWYSEYKRDLPWRATRDPYKIWLSEIILQQTKVDQGLPYYLKFIENYPNVGALALATSEEVLKLWEGLGYYSRAKNLHKCAKKVVESHGGVFPNNYNDLLTLSGIGPYSAAAIASFAYKEPVAVLDGNVYRVLSRVFGIKEDISQSKTAKKFTALANELLDLTQPDHYNQAIMEYGAMHCKPRNPLCESCKISTMCYGYANNEQLLLPVKSKKVKVSIKYFHYFVFEKQGKLAMKKRNDAGIWKGLYDFHLISSDSRLNIEALLVEFGIKRNFLEKVSKEYKHLLTHQRIYSTFYRIILPKDWQLLWEKLSYYTFEEIKELPKPILISKYLKENIF